MAVALTQTELLAILQPWSDIAEGIHRRLANVTDAEAGQEVLWVGAGSGRSVRWWTERFRTHTVGVDPDARAIEQAEAATRNAGLGSLVGFQAGAPDDLPFEAAVFDIVVADVLHLRDHDNRKVVEELARVARPMATIAAMVPVWLQTPDEEQAEALRALGITPWVVMEWKQAFREAGVVELAVDDAAQDGGWLAHGWVGLLVRAWRVARWAGVRTVLGPEVRAFRHLAQQRLLGYSIVKGTRWPHEA